MSNYRRPNNNVLKGNILRPSARIKNWFRDELKSLTRRMEQETLRELLAIYEAGMEQVVFSEDASVASRVRIRRNALLKRWQQKFNEEGKELAERMVRQTNRNAEAALKASIRAIQPSFGLTGSIISPGLKEAAAASIEQAVSLIRTIPEKYFNDVTGAVMRSVQSGGSLETLRKELGKLSDRSARHVELMAEDQTRKAYAAITERKMEALGIDEFIWVHTGGGRDPRNYHKYKLNGKIYKLSDPPVIDPKTGETGLPGQLINCHCLKRPVINLNP